MRRSYVTHVRSNLKSPDGEEWSVDVGQRTLIVGSNTSHKSTIIQAIELALTGAVDDVVGRSAVREASLLLTLSPTDELSSKVTLSDGDSCGFKLVKGKRAPTATYDTRGDQESANGLSGALPLRAVKEALAGSAETAQKHLVSWMGAHITTDDILGQLPVNLHAKYQDLAQYRGRNLNAVQTLLSILEYAGKQQRAAAKEMKGAQSIVQSLEDQIEEIPSDEAIEAAQQHLASLTPGTSIEGLDDRIAIAQNLSREWRELSASRKKDLAAEKLLYLATLDEMDQCPACSSSVGGEHLQACHRFYQNRIEESVSDTEDTTYLQASLYAENWAEESRRLESLQGVDGSAYEEARRQLDELQRTHTQWESLSSARRGIEAYEEEVASYKALAAACKKCINKIVSSRVGPFCETVNRYLPKAWNFHIEINDKVVRVGFMRDGQLHVGVSGAEWAAMKTAIAMAAVESQPGVKNPAVLIPEDRAWDPSTLAAVMKGYNKFKGQVIMASTVRPRGRPSKAWTIIDVEADDSPFHQATAPAAEAAPEEEAASTNGAASITAPVTAPTNGAPKKKTVRRKKAPANSSRHQRILTGLGFTEADITKMLPGTVTAIIDGSYLAQDTTVRDDGSYEVASQQLPRLQ